MTTNLAGEDPAKLRLSFDIDKDARDVLEEEIFAKSILFSDKRIDEAGTAQIVVEYRPREADESDFRQM